MHVHDDDAGVFVRDLDGPDSAGALAAAAAAGCGEDGEAESTGTRATREHGR